MTTKKKSELPQCLGVDCPLGIEHPPNGEEFSIGCSLCRGTDFYVEKTNPPQDDDEKKNDDDNNERDDEKE